MHYKDEPVKLARIMDKLLDRDVHQLIKAPIVSSYYSSNPHTKAQVCSPPGLGAEPQGSGEGVGGVNSRPHSSTSAELDTSMSALTVQPQPTQQQVLTRGKENR